MRLLKRLLARFCNLASRQSDDQRFLEEMEEHISRQTEEHLRAGMTPAEARRQALLKFGAVEASTHSGRAFARFRDLTILRDPLV
jgi:putative ABC transport system permease protein